jgi:hypothetical protein
MGVAGVVVRNRFAGGSGLSVMVNMAGGPGTNTIGLLLTAQDWASDGQIQQSLNTDREFQKLQIDAGRIATWENYVSQTIDV